MMDVAERENELQRQREERQPAAESLVRPEPPHHTNSGLITHSRRCYSVYDAAAGAQRHNNIPQAGSKRLMRAVALKRQSRCDERNRCAGTMSRHQRDASPSATPISPFPISSEL
jgi:hypothetical protein